MEMFFDNVQKGISEEDISMKEMIQELRRYQESGLWLMDYEADERGELPAELKRGVLSQDGLYDLLNRWEKEKKPL